MKYLVTSKKFKKQLKKLSSSEQQEVLIKLKNFLSILNKKNLPHGYGFKKINGDKYEIRVGLKLRIVIKSEGDTFICHLVGNHEQVKKYLREYRNK